MLARRLRPPTLGLCASALALASLSAGLSSRGQIFEETISLIGPIPPTRVQRLVPKRPAHVYTRRAPGGITNWRGSAHRGRSRLALRRASRPALEGTPFTKHQMALFDHLTRPVSCVAAAADDTSIICQYQRQHRQTDCHRSHHLTGRLLSESHQPSPCRANCSTQPMQCIIIIVAAVADSSTIASISGSIGRN